MPFHPCFLSLFAGLIFSMPSPAQGDEEKPYKHDESADYSITWVGSAFKQGDAFTVTANIFKDKADIHWKGYKDNRFDFMSEKKKEMFEKSFTLDDEKSVTAFSNIARYGELCDDGENGYIGQGVSTDVTIRTKGSDQVKSMSYFVIDANEPLAKMMRGIPQRVKAAVGDGKARLDTRPLKASVKRLSKSILQIQKVADLLQKAYLEDKPLPAKELGEILRYPSREDITKQTGDAKEALLFATEAELLLSALLTKGSWKAIIGTKPSPQALLLELKDIEYGSEWRMGGMLPFHMDLSEKNLPATLISKRGKELLLSFIIGSRYKRTYSKYAISERVGDAYSLGFNKNGLLTVIAASRRSEIKDPPLLTFLEEPEVMARLRYLNRNGIIDFLFLKIDRTSQAPPMTLALETITISSPGKDLAKISYFLGNDWKIIGLQKIDGKWQAGRVWDWHDYHKTEDAFSHGEVFRTNDGEIRK